MNHLRLLIVSFIIFVGVSIVQAQADCATDNTAVIQAVEQVCRNIGANEVCYGNSQVNAVPRPGVTTFNFDAPGDSATLSSIRSLFLSALSSEDDTWGVAQMRLLVNQGGGTQDVTMLLFGDVSIDNAVEEPTGVDVVVQSATATIYNLANAGSLQLETVPGQTTLKAISRLENNAWVKVEVPETGAIGWVLAGFIAPASGSSSIDTLPVEAGDAPSYGAMQAFYFSNGTSEGCSDTAADGLLIQTPEGVARVSLLINEVSIELTSNTSEGASAFVQANPEQDGMAVNVIDGTAYVETNGGRQTVQAGEQTSIPISLDLKPLSVPSLPRSYNTAQIQSIPLLPVVRDPSRPIRAESNPLPPSSVSNSTVNVNRPADNQNSSSNSNSGTGSSDGGQSQNSTNNTTVGSGSGSSTGNTTATSGGTSSQQPEATEQDPGEISVVNIVLAILAVIGGVAFVAWMVVRSHSES